MRYLSLFSGIEAASVAWEPLGFKPMAFADIDAFPSAVLAQRYPDAENLGDITKVDWEKWKAENGSPDILVGGSPCQSFSVAGKRGSLDDARGNLTLFTAELVRYLNPRVFLWENVPGVLSTKDNAFGCFLAELTGASSPLIPDGRWQNSGVAIGEERRVAWRVLDAQWFGVAQRRRRVFLVASTHDGPDPLKILFEPEGLRRYSPPSREAREDTTTSAKESVGAIGCDTYNGAGVSEDTSFTLTAGDRHAVLDNQVFREGGFGGFAETEAAGTLKREGGNLSGGSESLVLEPIVVAPSFSRRPTQQIANRDDGISYALTAGEPPRVLTSTLRRLTPLECERLQGFHDGWTLIEWRGKPKEECPDSHRYKALGNSMAVPVMRWLGARIKAEMLGTEHTIGIPEQFRDEVESR